MEMINPTNKGFTLLELLVAIAIFSIVMTAASGIFGTALQNQERMLARQLALNNTSYALEYMSRALRMAKKDTDGVCLVQSGCNYENVNDVPSSIRFLNHEKDCVKYFLEDNQIKREKEGEVQAFTSDDLNIKNLGFKLTGECQGDQKQPVITIFLEAETEAEVSFESQTTVTQRNLDVPK